MYVIDQDNTRAPDGSNNKEGGFEWEHHIVNIESPFYH